MNWYYYDGLKPVGPLSVEAMIQLRNCGILNAETPVAPEGADNWQAFDVAMANLPKLPPPPPKVEGRNAISKLAAGVGAIAGLDIIESSGGFRAIFKDVFKKRTIEEMESQFAFGTPVSTPALGVISTQWPSPWVFFRLITFSVVATIGFYWLLMRMQDPVVLPGWIFVGAFGIPFSVLVFFLEANVLKNVSFYRVLKLFMLGGMLSLIFTALLNELTNLGSWMGMSAAGPIEEAAKILAVVAFASRWRDKHWTLNGMLFGAAVGAGFAAFETAGYILARSGFYGNSFEGMMFQRALLAPFTHVIWTAATGAALWRLKGDRDFSFGMLGDWKFLRVLVLVAGLHAVWNSSLVIPLVGSPWGLYLKFLALGLFGWLLTLLLIQDGLAQIRDAQTGVQSDAEPEPLIAAGVNPATSPGPNEQEYALSSDESIPESPAP